ncbi:MAG: anti-sigma factor [Gemmatimonas sp.]
MSEFSMTELRDMAPAYVLGSLNADEQTAFERALATSEELAQEVRAYRAVVTRIGSLDAVAPPPNIRARFLDRIATQQSAALPTLPAAPPVADPRPFTVSTGNVAAPRTTSNKSAEQRWWLIGIMGVGLAASLLFAVQRNSEVTTLTTSLAQRDSVLAQRDSILGARDLKLAQRDSALNTVLEAERNLVMVSLVSAPTNAAGIQFFWNVKQGTAMIHAFHLKPAAPGRTYQLWLIKDGKPVPSRVFNADPDERGLVWGIQMPADTKGVTAVAITDEPAGGSPQPTTTPFMVGALPKAAAQ